MNILLGSQVRTIFIIMGFFLSNISYGKKSQDPIIVIENDWTSQVVMANLLKQLLQDQGYHVSLRKLKTDKQWGEISRGWAHIQVEVWQGTMEEMFHRVVKSGGIDAGNHDATTREDWWYPLYVEKLCPGLPNWQALKNCAEIFATPSSGGKGRYLGGPWEKPDKARIRALGLDFVIERVNEGDELWVELDKAYKNKDPIILFNWTPNWVESKYHGKFVEFPEYDPKCEKDKTWGISKIWKYDCGNPKNGWLKKLAWEGVAEKWPCAFKLLTNFKMTNSMIAELSSLVDSQGLSLKEAALKWKQENKTIWQNWLPETCTK